MRAAALALATLVMAGCAGEPVSRTGDHVHGGFYECPDGTRLDPGDFRDHHQDGFDIASRCPEPGRAAHIDLDAPLGGAAYTELRFEWLVVPARDGHHAQETELRITDAEGETEPLGRVGSTMVPRVFRAAWTPVEPGGYHVQAWARVTGEEVTSRAVDVRIAEVEPTGIVHDVTIEGTGPLASIAPAALGIDPGDAVRFVNQDVVAHDIVAPDPNRSRRRSPPAASM